MAMERWKTTLHAPGLANRYRDALRDADSSDMMVAMGDCGLLWSLENDTVVFCSSQKYSLTLATPYRQHTATRIPDAHN